jgi:hypothetical protein
VLKLKQLVPWIISVRSEKYYWLLYKQLRKYTYNVTIRV